MHLARIAIALALAPLFSSLNCDPVFIYRLFFLVFTHSLIMATFKLPGVGTVVENIAKLDARLLAMFHSLGLHENVMAVLAELGVISTNSPHARGRPEATAQFSERRFAESIQRRAAASTRSRPARWCPFGNSRANGWR